MARFHDPTPEQLELHRRWCESLPPEIRAVAERLSPWELYRIGDQPARVTVSSIYLDNDRRVKVTVCVSGQFNRTLFERRVFGVSPDELQPCDLPPPGEELGALVDVEAMNDADRAAFFERVREVIDEHEQQPKGDPGATQGRPEGDPSSE
jgi:hypothetical protein